MLQPAPVQSRSERWGGRRPGDRRVQKNLHRLKKRAFLGLNLSVGMLTGLKRKNRVEDQNMSDLRQFGCRAASSLHLSPSPPLLSPSSPSPLCLLSFSLARHSHLLFRRFRSFQLSGSSPAPLQLLFLLSSAHAAAAPFPNIHSPAACKCLLV